MQILAITESILGCLQTSQDKELVEKITKTILDKTYGKVFLLANNRPEASIKVCGIDLYVVSFKRMLDVLKSISKVYSETLILSIMHDRESTLILNLQREDKMLKICSVDISKYGAYSTWEYLKIEDNGNDEAWSNIRKYQYRKMPNIRSLRILAG